MDDSLSPLDLIVQALFLLPFGLGMWLLYLVAGQIRMLRHGTRLTGTIQEWRMVHTGRAQRRCAIGTIADGRTFRVPVPLWVRGDTIALHEHNGALVYASRAKAIALAVVAVGCILFAAYMFWKSQTLHG